MDCLFWRRRGAVGAGGIQAGCTLLCGKHPGKVFEKKCVLRGGKVNKTRQKQDT